MQYFVMWRQNGRTEHSKVMSSEIECKAFIDNNEIKNYEYCIAPLSTELVYTVEVVKKDESAKPMLNGWYTTITAAQEWIDQQKPPLDADFKYVIRTYKHKNGELILIK